jgi:hypothetical protein
LWPNGQWGHFAGSSSGAMRPLPREGWRDRAGLLCFCHVRVERVPAPAEDLRSRPIPRRYSVHLAHRVTRQSQWGSAAHRFTSNPRSLDDAIGSHVSTFHRGDFTSRGRDLCVGVPEPRVLILVRGLVAAGALPASRLRSGARPLPRRGFRGGWASASAEVALRDVPLSLARRTFAALGAIGCSHRGGVPRRAPAVPCT